VGSRLVRTIIYVLLAVIVALAIPLVISLSRRGTSELASDTLITAQTLGAYISADNIDDPQALAQLSHEVPNAIQRVVVTNVDGTVVYDSSGASTGDDLADDQHPEIGAALAGDPFAEVRYSQAAEHDNMYAAAPIIDDQIVGSISLTRDARDVTDASRSAWMGIALVAAAGLLAGLVIAYGLAGSRSRRPPAAAPPPDRGDSATVPVDTLVAPTEVEPPVERPAPAQLELTEPPVEPAQDQADDFELRRQLEAAEAEADRLSEILDRLLVGAATSQGED
jgi:hypothetical protein